MRIGMSIPKGSGIYKILNTINGMLYVGATKNFRKRWDAHKVLLRKGGHYSYKLQRDWNHYGSEAFSFEVLELVEPDKLFEAEKRYIDSLGALSSYNGCGRCECSVATPRDKHSGKFQQIGSESLAEKPICVRFPVEIDEALRAMPDKADWIRRAVFELAKREGLI